MDCSLKRIPGRAKIFAFLVLLAGVSCSPARYVPQDRTLLNRVSVKVDNKTINRDELNSYIKQHENTRILGFLRFHLWLYNISNPEKKENWLKRAGEPPQIYNEALAEQSAGQLQQFFHNKGYYNARIGYETKVNKKQKKRDLRYLIETGNAYRISNISYEIRDSVIRRQFEESYQPHYLREGRIFDLSLLDRERDLLVQFYKNRGYYYFSKPLIYFEADTTLRSGYASLKMFIGLPGSNDRDSAKIFRSYQLNNFTYNVLPGSQDAVSSDTLQRGRHTFIFPGKLWYHPELFLRMNKMTASGMYHAGYSEDTFNALNRLRQFRLMNIYFQEENSEKDTSLLNCFIDVSPLSRQSTSFDIEGTNTSGNFGIAGNLNYSHRNLFHGAEVLDMKLKGAMERQQAILGEQSLDFNTREIGVEATLTVPKLIGPGSFFPSFGKALPKTLFTLGYNYQRRPDYTRTISTLKFGYEWMPSDFVRNSWNILDFNMVNLSRFDPEFLNSIYDLYIRESFTDHLIMATGYTFVYNTQTLGTRSNYSFMRITTETSGNVLNVLSHVTGAAKTLDTDTTGLQPRRYYKFLDTRYAQYLRGDCEFRKGYVFDDINSLVGRIFLGVGFPYGNFDILPFEKKYFTGGANGIRAWQVRSLGPGTYRAPRGSYPNQSGDIKLEANLEYRFKLIKYFEGALFLDAGNVWAINEKDNRPGAQFKTGEFYKQLALGTGAGFRFDFDYFIFRLDLGLKMRDPAQVENKGWILGTRKLTGDDVNLSFAIGYPF